MLLFPRSCYWTVYLMLTYILKFSSFQTYLNNEIKNASFSAIFLECNLKQKFSKYSSSTNFNFFTELQKEWSVAVTQAKRKYRAFLIEELNTIGNTRSFCNILNGHRHTKKSFNFSVRNEINNKLILAYQLYC